MKYLCRAPVDFVFGCDGGMGAVFEDVKLLGVGCQLVMSSRWTSSGSSRHTVGSTLGGSSGDFDEHAIGSLLMHSGEITRFGTVFDFINIPSADVSIALLFRCSADTFSLLGEAMSSLLEYRRLLATSRRFNFLRFFGEGSNSDSSEPEKSRDVFDVVSQSMIEDDGDAFFDRKLSPKDPLMLSLLRFVID